MNEKYTLPKFLTFLVLVVLGIFTLILSVSGICLGQAEYADVVTFLLRQLNAEAYREQFESRYFTKTVFTALRYTVPFGALISGAALFICFRYRMQIQAVISIIRDSVVRLFSELLFPKLKTTTFEKVLLACMVVYILVIRLILSSNLPFHIDEMHSWLYFVDKGPLVSLSYYPSPNNHVLFSLLCCVTDIFTSEPMLTMRITSIVIGMMCSLLVFRFIFHYAGFSIALLGMLLFSFAPVVQHYSVLARGYMLETFFFILAFWAFLKLLKTPTSRTFQAVFVLSSVFGALTLITFLYATVGFGLVGLIVFYKNKNGIAWIKINVVFLILLVLAYTPLLLFSGPSAIVGNSWIIRPEWSEYIRALPGIYKTHADYFTSIQNLDVFLFPVLTFFPVWYLRNSSYRHAAFLSVTLLLVSFFICILQRIVPYERMWTHFLFCQQAMLAFCMAEFQKQTQWKLFWLFSKFLIVLVAFSFPLTMLYPDKTIPNIYNDAEAVSAEIMKNNPASVYCQEYVYFNYLSVYARHHKTNTLIENEGSVHAPDFVILESGKPWPSSADSTKYYRWRNCDPFVCIYRFKQ